MSRRGETKSSSNKSLILLARNNRILEETVRDQICRPADCKRTQLLDVKLCDFDEVSYNIKIENDTSPMIVAINWPGYDGLKDVINDHLASVYDDLVLPPDDDASYDAALSIDLDNLPDDEKKKDALVHHISLLKYHMMAAPFHKYCTALEEDKSLTEPMKFDLRADTTCYLIPGSDRVSVHFAVDFQEKVDKVLARVFMQELKEARKRVRTAPPFSWQVDPDPQLATLGCTRNPGILGYANLVMMKSHISGANKDTAIAGLIGFRTFIQYHLKCAKSYFHSRMRKRCTDLLKILNRAKISYGVKEKKTKSGKTFKRS